MKSHRKTFEIDCGQIRLFISSNGSSLLFTPHVDCYGLDWSTKEPGLLALRSVLERELTESQLGFTTILFGQPMQTIEEPGTPGIVLEFFNLTDAFAKDPADLANQVDFARFDFPTRAISLADVEPDFSTTGLSYLITRTDGQAAPADVQAMRRAFLDTADESLKPELDWALEAILS